MTDLTDMISEWLRADDAPHQPNRNQLLRAAAYQKIHGRDDEFKDLVRKYLERAANARDGSDVSELALSTPPRAYDDVDWVWLARTLIEDEQARLDARPKRPAVVWRTITIEITSDEVMGADEDEVRRLATASTNLSGELRGALEQAGWSIDYDDEQQVVWR